jgi:hypothetical protein
MSAATIASVTTTSINVSPTHDLFAARIGINSV